LVIFADFFLVFISLDVIHTIAAHVTDSDTGFFSKLAGELGKIFTALFGQVGDRQADVRSVNHGVEAQSARAHRFFHRLDIALVPDLDRQHAWFWHGYGRDL